jgi:uncharacterized membrane protein
MSMAETKSVHLSMFGFTDEMLARTVLEEIKQGVKDKEIVIEDWALATKGPDGKVNISTDTSVDPGAKRGAGFGGAAGLALAVLAGPIGVGAVVAGAAIGAVTAALRDAGMKDGDLSAITAEMQEGRSGLVIAVSPDERDRFEKFVAGDPMFDSAIRRVAADITPDHTLAQAIDEFRAAQAQKAAGPA